MRYIPVADLKEGMVLALPLYGGNFEILLAEGMALNRFYISRIGEMSLSGIYIADELSRGVEVPDIIDPALRIRTIKSAKEIMRAAAHKQAQRGGKVDKERQERIILPVINNLIANRGQLVNRMDLKPSADYFYYHAANVVVLSLLIGIELGVSGTKLFELGMAALLSDVGNIFIPKELLKKQGKLTGEEYETIQKHSEMGFDYLRDNFGLSIEACLGALQHHEHYDGSGYPSRLARQKISLEGRIIAVADVYDALTSRRPFREPLLPSEALEHIRSRSGTKFDPEITDAFGKLIAPYPAGFCVELSTGERGIVTRTYKESPPRPCVRLLDGAGKTGVADLYRDPALKEVQVARVIEP